MTQHLLAMELGPVVQMISAARKTRDMWFGSWMMSEVTKAAGFAASQMCGGYNSIIAPAVNSNAEFSDAAFSVGDEVLVIVPEAVDPAEVARTAKAAAHEKWLELAADAYGRVQQAIRDDMWDDQVVSTLPTDIAGEQIELYAAWVPLDSDYKASLLRVKRFLFGRTQCRNFLPASETPGLSREGLPKSSLDGRRETALKRQVGAKMRRRLRLLGGEQLDALGITKRVGQGRANYPSTARVAADPWIRGSSRNFPDDFMQLQQECERLATGDANIDPILGRVETNEEVFPSYPQYRRFAYEGAVLYESRHHDFLAEAEEDDEILAGLTTHLKRLVKQNGEPGAYYAVLIADGDNIGAKLMQCQSPDEHRELSRRLSAFAGSVRSIVERFQGALVFAAGEDVTAFVPIDTAIDCAEALRRRFLEVVNTGDSEPRATLSVGIAIGHFQDSLEDLLEAGRTMEHFAKELAGKNALAMQYRARSGSGIKFRYSWNSDPATIVKGWVSLFHSGTLVAYDLKQIVELYETWPASDDSTQLVRAMRSDVIRLLSSKQHAPAEMIRPLVSSLQTAEDLENIANTIIIADHIRKASELAGDLQPDETNLDVNDDERNNQ